MTTTENPSTDIITDTTDGSAGKPLHYLDKAMATLSRLGIDFGAEREVPIIGIIKRLESIDPAKVTAVARVLQQSSHFNAVVRDHIEAVTLSDRYEDIANNFDSIREDSKTMLEHVEDGKISLMEKVEQGFIKFRRGSISDRYQDIRNTYLDVAEDSKEQIEKERAILDAYADYRLAMKSGETVAYELFEQTEQQLNAAKATLETAQQEVASLQSASPAELSKAEMTRDEGIRHVSDMENTYQIAKDLAENLKTSYSTGEVVMARLKQTTDIKERVYQRAVTFFATNETVFTGLNAATTSAQGLNESTRVLETMEEGMNKGIEDLADIGGKVLTEGVKAGYGSGISADSVKKLVDAVVDFQSELTTLSAQMRQEATENAEKIAAVVEDGKAQMVALNQRA